MLPRSSTELGADCTNGKGELGTVCGHEGRNVDAAVPVGCAATAATAAVPGGAVDLAARIPNAGASRLEDVHVESMDLGEKTRGDIGDVHFPRSFEHGTWKWEMSLYHVQRATEVSVEAQLLCVL
ncbi:hypothetical protein GN244_ATG04700 [Phytophthora infestans]|uniref:Uncharacterized protein n=1 Tax=Phytophthora infestans TaxID=4787 RepID=A0A833TGV1_PHYIN|nr:hypothetical protein GN244_ATG04700 [Phytophthora infestans]